ncbi:MAG: DUF1592 domain-containing protein, partial [Planctomycetales bacterium]|nr:DUF1592 domain-containing protein [Planctomycetales bacterium]
MNENWVRLPILTAIASCLMPVTNLYASDSTGATIYAQHCANCHGADGQGADDGYQQPIFGDDSVAELASYIDRKMPEGEHELCVGDDARLVARYIYDEFYSFAAQQRKGLVSVPRIELSRLTVEQYRNAVADLVGSFAPQPRPTDQPGLPGLAAEYFQSDGMNKADKRKLERIDRQVDFDFGDEGPTDDIAADQFCVIWQGTIHPRHTGDYEFRIRTPNGVRLYVNCDPSRRQGSLRDDSSAAGQTALIDGWVSSGGMREHTAKVYLLGGRAYPIRLEFFKYKEELASVTMEWRPPLGVWSTLDHHHLSTTDAPRTFCVDTPFPPDDRSRGYERGSAVSREWYAAVSEGAIATANEVIDRLPALADLRDEKDSRREKVVEFLQRFAQTAFRRPLTDSERSVLDQMSTVDEASDEAVVRRVVLYVLSSPYFLYVDLTPPSQAPTAYTVASRLSFALWDSLPDAELLAAAERDELLGVEQLERQARRMLADPKSRQKLQGFFAGWLE